MTFFTSPPCVCTTKSALRTLVRSSSLEWRTSVGVRIEGTGAGRAQQAGLAAATLLHVVEHPLPYPLVLHAIGERLHEPVAPAERQAHQQGQKARQRRRAPPVVPE